MIDLVIEELVYEYPAGVRALDGLSLRIGAGEAVALVGQNGSGKTTLARHLNGLLRPTSGRVLLGGVDAAGSTVAALSRQVGLVFQEPDRQIFAGSVQREVEFGPRNLGLRGAALAAATAEALASVGLTGVEATNPYDLGAARRKLLAIASVLAMRTPVLVLDEPTTGQDGSGRRRIQEVVRRAAGEGRTVIAVSHDLRFVAETFPRVVVLRAGQVVLDAPPDQAFAHGEPGRPAEHRAGAAARRRARRPAWAGAAGDRCGSHRRGGQCGLSRSCRSRGTQVSSRRSRGGGSRRPVASTRSSAGSSSRCFRPSVGPGMGTAITEFGHFVEPLPDAAKTQLAERGAEPLGSGPVTEQVEQE